MAGLPGYDVVPLLGSIENTLDAMGLAPERVHWMHDSVVNGTRAAYMLWWVSGFWHFASAWDCPGGPREIEVDWKRPVGSGSGPECEILWKERDAYEKALHSMVMRGRYPGFNRMVEDDIARCRKSTSARREMN